MVFASMSPAQDLTTDGIRDCDSGQNREGSRHIGVSLSRRVFENELGRVEEALRVKVTIPCLPSSTRPPSASRLGHRLTFISSLPYTSRASERRDFQSAVARLPVAMALRSLADIVRTVAVLPVHC